jgi:chorismate mutase
MSVQQSDDVVGKFRDEITALDVRLLGTINERIKQVRSLREYKNAHGLAFVDPDREAALVAYLKRVNGGPISDDGLEELLTFVLDLVKRELER